MTKEEAIDVFEDYLKTGRVPNPYELQEAAKIAIDVINYMICYNLPTMTKEDLDGLKEYIFNLIQNRKKIGQEPTGDDLYAVLGHLELMTPSLPSDVDEAAKQIATDILGRDYLAELDEDCALDALSDAIRLVKAGAEWRDKQITKLPDSIDEAAEKYRRSIEELRYKDDDGYYTFTEDDIEDSFKNGAEWMASQGETHEATVVENYDGALIPEIYLDKFKKGDKVIIQIKKK